jgi:uncharacterized protein
MNEHPAVMFEIMAKEQSKLVAFYSSIFSWQVQYNKEGYAYILFPPAVYHLLGGIGQAQPGAAGEDPGVAFYIQVEQLQHTLDQIVAHGGSVVFPPREDDGYHYAMFRDPEGNQLGIIEPIDKS